MTTDQSISNIQYYTMPSAGWLQTLEKRLKKIPEFELQLNDIRNRAHSIVYSTRSDEEVNLIAQGISQKCKSFQLPDVESDDSQLYLNPHTIFQIHQDSDDVRVDGISGRIKSSESIAVGALVALNHVCNSIKGSKKLSPEQTKIVIDALLFGEWVFLMKEFRKEVEIKRKAKNFSQRQKSNRNSKLTQEKRKVRTAISEYYKKNEDNYRNLSIDNAALDILIRKIFDRQLGCIKEVISLTRNGKPINPE